LYNLKIIGDTSLNLPRNYSLVDKLCINLDQTVRGVLGNASTTNRPYPARNEPEPLLTPDQKKYSASLMRINHAGEVCAQALYHGQGLVSHDSKVRDKLQTAAMEEGDHLAWCRLRVQELGSHTSYLNPLWYTGSFAIGLIAGLCGDQWSLGFLAETEQQVVNHLEKHLKILPNQDQKSYVILQQMQEDEAKHRDDAKQLGGADLPPLVKRLMRVISKIMVKTARWI
jgi:ubiquinone biosynthesis monooxygenase Coq7